METTCQLALLDGELESLDREAHVKLIAKVEAEEKKAVKITAHYEKVATREQANIKKATKKIAKKVEKNEIQKYRNF